MAALAAAALVRRIATAMLKMNLCIPGPLVSGQSCILVTRRLFRGAVAGTQLDGGSIVDPVGNTAAGSSR
ncbi:MAG: hypothetical protein NVSMB64_04550 [Candidatus Velthaea sp.]